MKKILSSYTASISELKKSPTEVLKNANNEAVAILDNDTPIAYLVSSSLYEKMMDIIDEYYLSFKVDKALNDKEDSIKVDIDEL